MLPGAMPNFINLTIHLTSLIIAVYIFVASSTLITHLLADSSFQWILGRCGSVVQQSNRAVVH